MLPLIESLHDVGVVHGDIKLDNFILDLQGNVHIVDFGRSQSSIVEKDSHSCSNEEVEGDRPFMNFCYAMIIA